MVTPIVVAKEVACPACNVLIFAVRELYARLKQLNVNDQQRQELLENAKELNCILEKTEQLQGESKCSQEELARAFKKVDRILETCRKTCDEIPKTSLCVKLMNAPSERAKVKHLNDQLKRAYDIVDACIGLTSLECHRETQKGINRVEGVVRNPDVGVYPVLGTVLKRPAKIGKPVVECEDDLLNVEWIDNENPPGSLQYYEIDFEGMPNIGSKRVPGKSQGCGFGHEMLEPGLTYSIRVRGINSRGPGEWSQSTVCRYKECPPRQPPKPFAQVDSPTSIMLILDSPIQRHGEEPVSNIVVEFCDANATQWTVKKFPMNPEKDTRKFRIDQLSPDTKYHFRVKWENSVGDSRPSEILEVTTAVPIPGPPVEVRVSSKRTTNTLKLRWKNPLANPGFVDHYDIEIYKKSNFFKNEEVKGRKVSFKFTELKSGTNYSFRLRSFNKEGCSSEWTNYIKGETRTKGVKVAKAIAAGIGAGVGGTIGAPLIGALGGGMLAGSEAVEAADSKGGKIAAGTAAAIGGGAGMTVLCTLGAPFIGAATGIMAAMAVMEENLSEQSSDEEKPSDSDDASFGNLIRRTKKAADARAQKVFGE